MIQSKKPDRIPELRPELQLIRGAPSVMGEPTWLVHDPLLNRFVQIDFATYETLRKWQGCSTAEELIARVNASQQVWLDKASLEQLVSFLHANRLTAEAPAQGWRHFSQEHVARQHSPAAAFVHNYLFYRIPLCRPQGLLERTLPIARAMSSLPVRAVIGSMGLIGLYLVSREWDAFTATFQNFVTWEGALLIALALSFVKAAHELGHAYTAVAFGCRVHTMGVAFVVMAPLLYTDVSDAWRLRDRRQRLLIDSAGIKVEVAIAAIALFFWAFLPEGPMRGLAFTLSAVSVLSSLAINLNPFMRFDGYYLLSETLGVDNLQARAFELGRWKLREWLFGLGMPVPEVLSRQLVAVLVAYAWMTWIYRLALFVGIALLVYSYFFKVLGIILFAVEMIYFVGRPIMNELKYLFQKRRLIFATRRTAGTAMLSAVVLLLCLVPLSTKVEIPAIVESAKLQPIYPGRSARIAEVNVLHGSRVKVGDVIVRLVSPDVDLDIELARTKLAMVRFQHARRGADASDRASTIVLESSLESLLTRIEGLEKEQEELVIRAPFEGKIIELDPGMHPGRWVSPRDLIALVAAEKGIVAKGYVSESDLWRIAPGGGGTFIPEELLRESVPVKIEMISRSVAAQIEIAELTTTYSGRIAVNQDEKRRLVPTTAQYLVHMSSVAAPRSRELSVRGIVRADGLAESVLARVWRQALKVLVRESGA